MTTDTFEEKSIEIDYEERWWENYMNGLYSLDVSWECRECGRPFSICTCPVLDDNTEETVGYDDM